MQRSCMKNRMFQIHLLLSLIALFCLVLGLLTTACDDPESEADDESDCGDMCRKVQQCADLDDFMNNFEDLPQCIDRCKDVDTDGALACMLACDDELSCEEYEACLLDC